MAARAISKEELGMAVKEHAARHELVMSTNEKGFALMPGDIIVGLDRPSWEWHKRNPGRLSRIAQKAVHFEIALDALPDSVKDDCFEAVAAAFFDDMALNGAYGIMNLDVVRHEATDEEMSLNAEALGIPTGKLIPALQELFDLEKEYALRKAAVLRKYRSGKNVRQI